MVNKRNERLSKPKSTAPSGITVLSYIYLFISILSTLTLLISYKYIAVMIFGFMLPDIAAFIIRFSLFLVPLYLFFGFKNLNRYSWTVAMYYHCFFVINSTLSLALVIFRDFPVNPTLQIIARPELTIPMENIGTILFKKGIVYSINLLAGVFVVHYLNSKKEIFIND